MEPFKQLRLWSAPFYNQRHVANEECARHVDAKERGIDGDKNMMGVTLNDRQTLILARLMDGPKHGYGLYKELASVEGSALPPATLYRTLDFLASQGYIAEETGLEDNVTVIRDDTARDERRGEGHDDENVGAGKPAEGARARGAPRRRYRLTEKGATALADVYRRLARHAYCLMEECNPWTGCCLMGYLTATGP